MECVVDISTLGTLDDEPSNKVPFFVLYGTADESAMTAAWIEIDSSRIHLLFPKRPFRRKKRSRHRRRE